MIRKQFKLSEVYKFQGKQVDVLNKLTVFRWSCSSGSGCKQLPVCKHKTKAELFNFLR